MEDQLERCERLLRLVRNKPKGSRYEYFSICNGEVIFGPGAFLPRIKDTGKTSVSMRTDPEQFYTDQKQSGVVTAISTHKARQIIQVSKEPPPDDHCVVRFDIIDVPNRKQELQGTPEAIDDGEGHYVQPAADLARLAQEHGIIAPNRKKPKKDDERTKERKLPAQGWQFLWNILIIYRLT